MLYAIVMGQIKIEMCRNLNFEIAEIAIITALTWTEGKTDDSDYQNASILKLWVIITLLYNRV